MKCGILVNFLMNWLNNYKRPHFQAIVCSSMGASGKCNVMKKLICNHVGLLQFNATCTVSIFL